MDGPAAGLPAGLTTWRATAADAEALTLLHTKVWEDAYTGLMAPEVFVDRRARLVERADLWRGHLGASPAVTTLVADESGLIGFVSVGPGRDADLSLETELWALYLRAEWWGRGVGHALLERQLAPGPAYLWVLAGNERAVAFYLRHGFVADGTERHDEYGTELRMIRTGL